MDQNRTSGQLREGGLADRLSLRITYDLVIYQVLFGFNLVPRIELRTVTS
jgi:hypothetical protein